MLKQRKRTKYHVTGHVLQKKTQQPVSGVRVEAWDKDHRYDDFVGNSQTDKAGTFDITFDDSFFVEGGNEKSPDLYFKILREDRVISSTENTILWNAGTETDVTIEVSDWQPSQPMEPLKIKSFAQLMENEAEILSRIEAVPNGGNLFMIHPLMLLADVGVNLTDAARRELLTREPKLSALSDVPYNALKNSRQEQNVRFHIHGLFQKEIAS